MSKYILLPLRSTVAFPGLSAAVTVEEATWVTALERALASGAQVVALALREGDTEGLDPNAFYGVGTLADLKSVSRRSDGGADVVIDGLARVGIEAILTVRKPFQVRTVDLQEEESPPGTAIGQMKHAAALTERYSRLSRSLTPSVLESIAGIRRPGPLADYLAAHLPLDVATKQEVLEALEHRQRLDRMVDALSSEVEILEIDQKLRSRVRRQMERNQREYYLKEQLKAINAELGQEAASEAETLRQRARDKTLPQAVEQRVMQDIARLERTPPTSPESGVLRNYLELALSLPWNERTPDRLDVDCAQKILNEDHHGLDQVKDRILEFLAVKQLLSQRDGGERLMARGPVLCLVGPPGVGKTSLGRSIARAMNRKFQRVALGGVRDEAEIRGHRRTYVAAMAGRIIAALKLAGARNPVILLDEIDKMGADFRGDPAAALLEVLDPEQNHAFADHYLDLPFDLSEVLFIATANVQANIPRTLLDRLEIIELSSYTEEEKVEIARRFLLPRQLAAHGLAVGQVEAPSRILEEIIRHHTREAGVRGLERALATVCRRAARQVLRDPAKRVRVDARNLETYLGRAQFHDSGALEQPQIGMVTGLAWTERGGELMPIEAVGMPGKGNLLITGRLGDVMQESARAALSYARSRAQELGVDPAALEKLDFHIHVPEGAIPKDGPSAGVTMAVALISVLTQRVVPHDLAMTGEITLRGKVLPIGGFKEKVLAARRAGIRRVAAPAENQRDLPDLPRSARSGMEFIWVDTVDDLVQAVFGPSWTGPGGEGDEPLEPATLALTPLAAELPFSPGLPLGGREG